MSAEYFIELDPKEEVLAIVHKSMFSKWAQFGFSGFWFIASFFFFFPLLILGPFGLVIFILVSSTGGYSLLKTWISWKHTILIVTDMRVIDVDQLGFFKKDIVEMELDQIRNVSYEFKGAIKKMINIGTVIIETSKNYDFDIEINGVKNPKKVTDLLNDVQYLVEDRVNSKQKEKKSIKRISIYDSEEAQKK